MKDAKYYKNLDNPHALSIYEQYLSQQVHIARGLRARRYVGPTIKMMIAIMIIDRRQIRRVLSRGKHITKRILRIPAKVRKAVK